MSAVAGKEWMNCYSCVESFQIHLVEEEYSNSM